MLSTPTLPYDRFLHEQLAGDILAAEARRTIREAGHRDRVSSPRRSGSARTKLEDIHQIIEDTLNTTGQVVLGLSLRCARCHDHKYDPIPSRDYYALYGFFASTKYPFAGAEEDRRPSEFAPLVPPDRIKDYEAKHAEALARLKAESRRGRERRRGNPPGAGHRDACGGGRVPRRDRRTFRTRCGREGARDGEGGGVRGRPAQLDGQLRQLRAEIKRLTEAGPLAVAPAYAVRDGEADRRQVS